MANLSRRQLICGVSVAALSTQANQWARSAEASPTGKVQINTNYLYRGNNFPFINVAKTADRPWRGNGTGAQDVYELLDDNSMPKANPATGHLETAIDLFTLGPNDSWVVDWTGVGDTQQVQLNSLDHNFQVTLSMQIRNRSEYLVASKLGAPAYSLFAVRVTLTNNSSTNPVQNIRIFRKSDEKVAAILGITAGRNSAARLNINSTAGMSKGDNCYVADIERADTVMGCQQIVVIDETHIELPSTKVSQTWTSGGSVRFLDSDHYFMPEFLSEFKGFGRLRFTQWQQIIGSTVAQWSDRTTKSMMSWYGANIIGSHYVGAGKMFSNEYTSARARADNPSDWADGMMIKMRWDTPPSHKVMSGFAKDNPAKVTVIGHGYSNGDVVFFQPGSVGGMGNRIVNTLGFYSITVIDADNFSLDGVDSSAWPEYAGGGIVAKQIRVKAGGLPSKRVVGADGGMFYVQFFAPILATNPLVALTYDKTFDALVLSQISAGMPLEVMTDLSNELDIHPWFGIPHMADNEYVAKMATYVRDHLKGDLIASFELSNEVWNNGLGYSETGYASAQAILRWGNNITRPGVQSSAWYGWRFYNVMSVIGEVFKGQMRRINRVMAEWTLLYQSGPNDITPLYRHGMLKGPQGDLTPAAPIMLADSIAIAPYLEGNRNNTANTQYIWNYVYSGDEKLQAAALNWLDGKLRENDGKSHSLEYYKQVAFPGWAAMRDKENSKYGINLTLTCYEGGPGLIPRANTIVGSNPINGRTIVVDDVLAFFSGYYKSDYCKKLMADWLRDFAEVGGIYPSQYPLTGNWDTSGMFGVRIPNEFGPLIGAETALREFNGNSLR